MREGGLTVTSLWFLVHSLRFGPWTEKVLIQLLPTIWQVEGKVLRVDGSRGLCTAFHTTCELCGATRPRSARCFPCEAWGHYGTVTFRAVGRWCRLMPVIKGATRCRWWSRPLFRMNWACSTSCSLLWFAALLEATLVLYHLHPWQF